MRVRLIHPVSIIVQPLDKAASVWDSSAREPVARLRRAAPVTIDAQIHWARRDVTMPGPTGGVVQSACYLVFLLSDIEAATWTPAHGDKVTSIDGAAHELYLLGPGQQRGQYRRRTGTRHQIIRIYFTDRKQRHD